MARSRLVSAVSLIVFIVVYSCIARAACDPSYGRVDLTLPTTASNVSAPIELVAVANGSCRMTAMSVYLDGVAQWTQYRQAAVHVLLPASMGQKHWIRVKAWNSAGRQFVADTTVYVDSVRPDTCQSLFDFSYYLWPCDPRPFEQPDTYVLVGAKVRSDDAPLRETRVMLNGVLWARAYGAAAYRPAAHFMLTPGLYSVDYFAYDTAGTERHNGLNFWVKSQVACQVPVLSVSRPTPNGGYPLGQPIVFFAAADAGRQCSITAITVYADGKPQYRAWGQNTIDGRLWMPSGVHRVTIQAWNNRGEYGSYTLMVNAEETSEGYCLPDTTPGLILCDGGQPPLIGIGTSSDPAVPITAARIYVNGVKRADYYGAALRASYMIIALPPGTYDFRAVAWDIAGEVLTASGTYTIGP